MKYIKNVSLSGELTDIGVEGGKIAFIGKTDAPGEDLGGCKIYPGLIETHAHGCGGMDVMDEGENLEAMAEFLLARGTTTWYPTTMTMPMEDIIRATKKNINVKGANIPGFHLEGPFINPKFKGAQSADHIFRPARALTDACRNVKKITLAPELPGSRDFITESDALISLGHSDADYETAAGAFRAGVRCVTHTFNAMRPIHHREPGAIVAAIENPDVYLELIADGRHVHPAAVRMLIREAGEDRIVLVSDSIRALGMPDGDSELGGQRLTVIGGVALTADGKLAGSTSSLLDCVKSCISMGISEASAFRMASENPARMMGLNKGEIEVGYDADFIILDNELNLVKSVVRGEF